MTGGEKTYFKGAGDVELVSREWEVKWSKGVLAVVHGLGEHSGRYETFAKYFNHAGYSVHALDLRGHGLSKGRRAFADSIDQYLTDISIFVKQVESAEKKPCFLVGHSFGGQLVLNYGASAQASQSDLKGIIVSSPNIRLAIEIPKLKIQAGRVLSKMAPFLKLGNEVSPDLLSHDPVVVRAYKKDPLVQRNITSRLGDIILRNQEIILDLAKDIKKPIFLAHAGDDRICFAEGTRDFFDKILIEDKLLKIYKGFYHEIFNELEKEKVFEDVKKWIKKHL